MSGPSPFRHAGASRRSPWARPARLFGDRRLTLALRLLVGAVLIYASFDKLLDPRPFADAVDNYRILPLTLVDLTAIVLPWLEFLTGLCLVTGLAACGAGLVSATLGAVFTVAVAGALLRGLHIGCGCFAAAGPPLGWHDLWLRFALLAASLQIVATAGLLDDPLAWLVRPRRRPAATDRGPGA